MSRRRLALLACAAGAGAFAPGISHAAGGGLEIIPDPTKLIALLLLFVILVPVLNNLLFKPLLAVLDEREQRIDGARTRATELAQQAAALVARHDEAIRQARETAQAERARVVEAARSSHQSAIGEARSGAESEIAAARSEIERAAASVRASLGAEAEPLARDIAARLLGRSAA
jgi:F-type H+-transporting ATPase subunit b